MYHGRQHSQPVFDVTSTKGTRPTNELPPASATSGYGPCFDDHKSVF